MAGRRVSLSALATKAVIPAPTPPPAVDHEAPVVTEARMEAPQPSPGVAKHGSRSGKQTPAPPHRKPPRLGGRNRTPAPGEWVRYDQYERKEARLRPDQYGQLSVASRNLNRARGGRGERITENTLIRVAIDLLLNREGELTGVTEAELRRSVGL